MVSSEKLALNIRNHILDMTSIGQSSHIGSALSIADIVAVLYGDTLNFNANDPLDKKRDRFILSKGHAGVAVYAALAEVGFFPKDLLKNHYQNGSFFSGHISHKKLPGVEISTGSLGHGLGIGLGIAFSAKKLKKEYKVYVLLSDGECDEGSNWESFLFLSHHCLNNLITIIDYNKLQSIGTTHETLNLEPFVDKFKAFNLNPIIINGHDHNQLKEAFLEAHSSEKPSVIICNTIKGKGVSFMENSVLWHYRSPQGDEYIKAKEELN